MATRHTPAKLRPLSAEAQELARQNIQTVAGFLGHHRLTDDWYDIVIFRYLLTVQNWLDRPELHRYAFSTIAWRAMSSAVSNERRKQGRRIRAVSLDAPVPCADRQPRICTKYRNAFDGEPDIPVHAHFTFVPCRDTW